MAGIFTKNMVSLINLLTNNWNTNYSSLSFTYKNHQGISKTVASSYAQTASTFGYIANGLTTAAVNTTTPTVPSSGTVGYWYMCFGSGDTEPTEDDYTLDELISTLTWSSSTAGQTARGKQYTTVITNSTNVDIVVKEFALFETVYMGDLQEGVVMKGAMMLYREVLDTPITLEPGQTATFTAELTFV